MVDALMGVTIIALMIAICLGTIKVARHFSQSANTLRQADLLLAGLMETTPRVTGLYEGVSGAFSYRVQVEEQARDGIRLCGIVASVHPKSGGIVYHLQGTRWCDPVNG